MRANGATNTVPTVCFLLYESKQPLDWGGGSYAYRCLSLMASISDTSNRVNRSPVHIDALPDAAPLSADLYAANARLLQMREGQRINKARPNGDNWLTNLRVAIGELQQTKRSDEPEQHNQSASETETQAQETAVRVYPTLAHTAVQQGCVPALRVWLLGRHLDRQGRGWLPTADLVTRLTGKQSPLRICGKRRLNQIIQAGQGVFWIRRNGRIWFTGAAKLCGRLDIAHLDGRTVLIPLSGLTDSLKLCRAHLYATVHSRRRDPAPIARVTLTAITGACARSQREYDQLLKIERTACYHLGEKYTTDNLIESYWEHGNGFEFIDAHGRHGRKGASYIARQLGNRYAVPQQAQTATGRKKKINRYLNVLVKKQAQGNEQNKLERLYFPNGAAAAKAMTRKRQTPLAYWHSRSSTTEHDASRSERDQSTTLFFSVGENVSF